MPENSPEISVIIPSYNRGWAIKEAIDSVFAQRFDNFELIVVNDGSTDNTVEELSSFRNKIKLIEQNNCGVSAARNKGILCSAGNYIAFLDSDDLWLPGKLEAQFEFFNKNPGALICQTEEIWVRNGKRINPGKRHKKVSGFFFEKSLELCMVSPSAVMIKKNLFNMVGLFNETLPACEDYDMWLRINCTYPIYLIDTPFVVKRGGHIDQLSRIHSLDKYRIRSITNLINSNMLTWDQQKAAIKILKEKCRVYAKGCRKRGRMNEAEEYIRLSESV